jgi:small-conductance mechanosensitive channel
VFDQAGPLNPGLPTLRNPPDLETPQASLENFVVSCKHGLYLKAAWSLDLSSIPEDRQEELGPRYAQMLMTVMEQKVWLDWSSIPDRPDGEQDNGAMDTLAVLAQHPDRRPIRALKLGSANLGERDVEFWLERIRPRGASPVWVMSRRTVERVPALYQEYGPSKLEKKLPSFLRSRIVFGVALWQWVGILLFLLVGGAMGWGVQTLVVFLFRKSDAFWMQTIARSAQGPLALTVGLGIFQVLAINYLRLAGPVMVLVEPLVFSIMILGVTWLLQRSVNFASTIISRRVQSNPREITPTILTQVTMARHFLTAVVTIVGICVALSQFEWFRSLGYGLLASAGVAAFMIGLAAQRPLGNLFAGIQLAITQPVRSGDAVVFEGQYGWIDRIEITYITIRTWDLRRLVVPTAYLLDKPLENWTADGPNLIKPVYFYADYRLDVEALRSHLEDVLHESDDYDGTVPPVLQIVGCHEQALEIRVLCSARNPGAAWNLHCLVRERMIEHLRNLEGGRYLPRTRVLLVGHDPSDEREAAGFQHQHQ